MTKTTSPNAFENSAPTTQRQNDRILVVEDDRDTQANLRDILELDGYEVASRLK